VFLLFDELVAECCNDAEVEVVIDDVQSSEIYVKMLADWVNPYTYIFNAPGKLSSHVDAVLSKLLHNNNNHAFLWFLMLLNQPVWWCQTLPLMHGI